jgi:uncharacterized protein (DUF58 family)
MLGGALRGFNLLLVLAGLVVGALIMQWRWSRRSIESTSVQRRLPAEAFAGRPFRVRYLLHNQSRFLPAWMIRIEDRIESVDCDSHANAITGIGMIGARRTMAASCDCTILRRGKYRFGPIRSSTTFPLALLHSQKQMELFEDFHVFPRILTLHGRWRRQLMSRIGGASTTARRSGALDGDFFGLREWQAGDSRKWIHWRTTARINQLAVRQFEQQRRFDTCILVDAWSDTGRDSVPAESAISLAATLLIHLVGSPSNQVVLAVAGKTGHAVMVGGSDAGKRRMLRALAEVESTSAPALAQAARQAMKIVGYTQDLLVISTRSMRAAKEVDPEFVDAASPWLRRGSLRWIDVSSELDRWVSRDPSPVESEGR